MLEMHGISKIYRTDLIETHALRAFGETVTEEWLANIRARHEESRKELLGAVPFEEAQRNMYLIDRKLHRDIVEALDNRAIIETHARLQDNLTLAKRVHQRSVFKGQLLDTIDEHLRIITALEQRDIQLFFQFLDGDAQGRLADVTALGGTSKVLLLRQCHDVAQLSQGHGVARSSSHQSCRAPQIIRQRLSVRISGPAFTPGRSSVQP